jgi:hypothetical protein
MDSIKSQCLYLSSQWYNYFLHERKMGNEKNKVLFLQQSQLFFIASRQAQYPFIKRVNKTFPFLPKISLFTIPRI